MDGATRPKSVLTAYLTDLNAVGGLLLELQSLIKGKATGQLESSTNLRHQLTRYPACDPLSASNLTRVLISTGTHQHLLYKILTSWTPGLLDRVTPNFYQI